MAALSVQEYLDHFLLPKVNHERSKACLLAARVYLTDKDGSEQMIYARKIISGKNVDPLQSFTKDMTGSNREGGLSDGSKISVEIMSSRSPSNVGAEQLQGFLDYCKKHSIKVNLNFSFAQPYSWDNKFNKEGLRNLYEKGVKLKVLSFQQVINAMLNDMNETLESLDDLQTCRGTLTLEAQTLKRAMSKFQDVLVVDNDSCYRENNDRLQEILGYQNGIAAQTTSHTEEMTGFSLSTYRDYFLLQNSDEIWAKFKVNLRKKGACITQEESLFEKVYCLDTANNNGRSPQDKVHNMADHLWKLVGDNVTMNELSTHKEVVIQLTVVISEYPDRDGFCSSLHTLVHDLNERIEDAGLQRVRVETSIRYAMDESSTVSPNSSLLSSPSSAPRKGGKSSDVAECMHLQDLLLDMLEDLEDNFKLLGRLEYGGVREGGVRGGGVGGGGVRRGMSVRLDKAALSSALGLLNKAIKIEIEDERFSMNGDFEDAYAEAANQGL